MHILNSRVVRFVLVKCLVLWEKISRFIRPTAPSDNVQLVPADLFDIKPTAVVTERSLLTGVGFFKRYFTIIFNQSIVYYIGRLML